MTMEGGGGGGEAKSKGKELFLWSSNAGCSLPLCSYS
jgi:hypothetical protein